MYKFRLISEQVLESALERERRRESGIQTGHVLLSGVRNKARNTHVFYKHTLFWAQPGKEIEITTNKLTTMCLEYEQFEAYHAYKLRAYKK